MADRVEQIKRFCDLWAENIASSLAAYGVVSPTVTAKDVISAPALSQQEFDQFVCIRFTCSGAAKGELLWVAEKPAVLQIAQLLTGSPSAATESPQLSDEDRDAFAEFLRQASGNTATAWKARFSSDLALTHEQTAVPAAGTAQCSTFTLAGGSLASVVLRLFLDKELTEALASLPLSADASASQPAEPPVAPESAESKAPGSPAPESVAAEPKPVSSAFPDSVAAKPVAPLPPAAILERTEPLPANLALVLDVALEATIRFGQREMLLRDIFGLMAGAVIELDQLVNEPAELHVAGRLVARGEVVVVDGNFGLRVTEVAALHERVAAIHL